MNKSLLRAWAPPAVLRIANRLRHGESGLSGVYPDWEAATRNAGGYDDATIFDRVVEATDKAIESEGRLFERDSVLFDHPVTPFPLLSCLLSAALRSENGLTVVDFGGALGSTYHQCSSFLAHIHPLRWKIVEQAHVADAGRKRFSSDALSFHDTLADASEGGAVDVIVLSGVLQYLEDPYSVLAHVCALKPAAILIDRTPASALTEDVFSVQVVSPTIFAARFPFRIFGAGKLNAAFGEQYQEVANFPTVDPDMIAGSVQVRFRGNWFERVSAT